MDMVHNLTVIQLKDLCKQHKLPGVSKLNRSSLVYLLTGSPDPPDKSIESLMIEAWLLGQSAKSSGIRQDHRMMGLTNEAHVIENLKTFLQPQSMSNSSESFSLLAITQIGLLAAKECLQLAASIDAVAIVSSGSFEAGVSSEDRLATSKLYGVEVKTRLCSETIHRMHRDKDAFGAVVVAHLSCLTDEIGIQQATATRSDLAQVIHQCSSLDLEGVFYVEAGIGGNISRVVLLRLSPEFRKTYRSVLRCMLDVFLPWTSDVSKVASIRFDDFGGRIDKDCLIQQLSLTKHLTGLGLQGPIPHCCRLTPSLIAAYNKGKVGVDTMSQYVSMVDVSLRGLHPMANLWKRFLIVTLLNGFTLTKAGNSNSPSVEGSKTMANLKKNLSRDMSFHGYLLHARTYFAKAIGGSPSNLHPPLPSPVVEESKALELTLPDTKERVEQKIAKFNGAEGTAFRFSGGHCPIKVDHEHRKSCFMCSNRTQYICARCKLCLCIADSTHEKKRRVNEDSGKSSPVLFEINGDNNWTCSSCWYLFHSKTTIERCPEIQHASSVGSS
jgi:hypothetical protein